MRFVNNKCAKLSISPMAQGNLKFYKLDIPDWLVRK